MSSTKKQDQPSQVGEFNGTRYITPQDIRNAIPAWCFQKDELRFMVSVFYSGSLLFVLGLIAHKLIPLTWWALPLWIIYACVNGTVLMGWWVLGHECGHGSFSNNQLANDVLGFVLHTTVLVPYFSWQWSHFVHHSKNSHIHMGETHIPLIKGTKKAEFYYRLREIIGVESFALFQFVTFFFFGFPLYFLLGVSGGKGRGFTSHVFVPNKLFPEDKLKVVMLSNIGIISFLYLLYVFAQHTSYANVMALYGGPYLIVNAWLTIITWLHHTDQSVKLYDDRQWNWLKGALGTIDRNYPGFINALQFDIGSTHVTHHIYSDIPHYNAQVANEYVKNILGPLYNHDKKSITQALYETTSFAGARDEGNGEYTFD